MPPLYYTSPRGQCAVMLLATLYEMYTKKSIGQVSKREAIRFISDKHWFDIHDEDLDPYQSQNQLSGEPRWHTLIAWARKDGVIRDFIAYEARDTWGMTRLGRDLFERFQQRCTTGAKPVAPCFLWSVRFKRYMDPNFQPGPTDKNRPSFFYRDSLPNLFEGMF
jgi:hypothetical protein